MVVMMIIMVENTVNDYLQPLLVLSLQSRITKQAHLFLAASTCQKTFPPPPKKKQSVIINLKVNFASACCSGAQFFHAGSKQQAACSPLSFSSVILPMFCHSCRLCCVLETSLCETRKLTCSIFELSIPIQLKNSTNNKNNSTITKT